MRGGQVVKELLARIGDVDGDLAAHDDLAGLRDSLAASVAALSEASELLLGRLATDPAGALAGATPYLRLFASVVGGWLLARQAVTAREVRTTGEDAAAFYEAKVASARYYGEQLLPTATALLATVQAGARDLGTLARP